MQPDAELKEMGKTWILYVDDASNSQGSGARLILAGPEGERVEYALRLLFKATNNQAKYEAMLAEINREYEARDPIMSRYLEEVRLLISSQTYFNISYIPQSENAKADTLFRLAASMNNVLGSTYIEHLESRSIEAKEEVFLVTQEPMWMDTYIRYLIDDTLPTNREEARLLKWRASKFALLEGWLYKRSFSYPLLKCVGLIDTDYILREIHGGICGDHLEGRSLANKALH